DGIRAGHVTGVQTCALPIYPPEPVDADPELAEFQAEEHWAQPEITGLEISVREFGELRVGVYGLGGIGTAVARRALALGMSVAEIGRASWRERGGVVGVGEG